MAVISDKYVVVISNKYVAVISDKYVAVISNKYVAVISEKYVAVISDKYVAILFDGRRPTNNLFSLQFSTVAEPKSQILRTLFFHNFSLRNHFVITIDLCKWE